MKYAIAHELPGRIRLRCGRGAFSRDDAGVIEYLLESQDGVMSAEATHKTGSILILFSNGARDGVLSAVRLIDRSYLDNESLPARPREESIAGSAFVLFVRSVLNRLSPLPIRLAINTLRYMPYLFRGIKSLISGKLDVSVLDASAIGVSLLLGDVSTAGTIMTLLTFGDVLESWTKERSKRRLAEGLALNESFFWIERDGAQVRIPASELAIGDNVVVRAGSVIPVDGSVVRGNASVNQAIMTGEPLSLHRYPGTSVFAGTLVEDGELIVRVTAFDSETRINRIVKMIDESENMKAKIQDRAENMADGIVPYSFLLAGLAYLVTGDVVKATSALLVDYSCAIKLSTPLAILSAMREGTRHGIVAKGGRILEKIAEADTVVFDKTGTLSVASPTVADVVPFAGFTRKQVLRTSACLEEHFPHSIARAVVRKAEEENLQHREDHAEVEYSVAHGIVSHIGDVRVIIGSDHFVLEDEHTPISDVERDIISGLSHHYSLLYLAAGGRLAGIICIEDPIREEAAGVVADLRGEGIKNIVMLTGDNYNNAEYVARELGIDCFRAQLLPEQKTEFVQKLKDEGRCVIMIGDGINDSPALSVADVGIAMKESADIAREISDVVLTHNDLKSIVTARKISTGVMRRIHKNYVFIVAVNSALLAMGLSGVITPASSALFHNASTIGASMSSMRPLLEE
ncbi:MAG: heavy metal translocating P-type ATPase [Synergistaceae bacterium]|jgi:heavy metal translocating P-type ATPase|nr:heavy metal translocating P-type ATPase [Synergistaceae bacterium]